MKRKLAYFEDRGSDMKVFSLLLAVYNDRFEDAEAILKAEPAQLNSQDPYAGLTALHIAIFRQNPKIVQLLLTQEGIDVRIKDGFGRRPVDMLDYTANQDIFDMVMDATYPDAMLALEDETFDHKVPVKTIIPYKPRGP